MANCKRVMKNPYTFAGNGGLLIYTILNVISPPLSTQVEWVF